MIITTMTTTCHLMDFAVAVDQIGQKKGNFINKYLEVKKLWNTKVPMIQVIVGALWMVTKDPKKRMGKLEFRLRIENIQTTAVLKSTRILKRVLETRVDFLSCRPVKNQQKKSALKKLV